MKLSEIIETLQRHETEFSKVDVLSLEFDGEDITIETGPPEAERGMLNTFIRHIR